MAAADYYTAGAIPPTQPTSSPYLSPPRPQRTASGPSHPNPSQQQTPAPPPYQPFQEDPKPGVHFAPSPAELQQRHSFSGQQRPSFSNPPPPHRSSLSNVSPRGSFSNTSPHRGSLSNTPPQRGSFSNQQRPPQPAWNPNMQNQYPPPPNQMGYNNSPQMSYGTPPQQNGYLAPPPAAPHMRPYINENYSRDSFDTGYASDPESHRRHHEHRSRRKSKEVRDIKGRSRSTNTDGFIGAAGGGLIGDLIFPGLGTIGGAALGWLGGKDYGNHRKWREDKRERDQTSWEGKHRSSRSRGYSDDLHDDRGRRHSYDRRQGQY